MSMLANCLVWRKSMQAATGKAGSAQGQMHAAGGSDELFGQESRTGNMERAKETKLEGALVILLTMPAKEGTTSSKPQSGMSWGPGSNCLGPTNSEKEERGIQTGQIPELTKLIGKW